MEIERKFLIHRLPENLDVYPCHIIEQAYLCTDPVVRIRRQDDDFILTYKGAGLMSREEYNLPLNVQAYEHLRAKADGHFIRKKRYVLPLTEGLNIELDVFDPPFAPLVLAEVEFPSEEAAKAFVPPSWFGEDVTYDGRYHNNYLSRMKF
ncbi:MAG: CYTH domain-containing protein [Eubacteriales bacterium]|nr:CYTH domain-containing protein [Eubacteriales bacterium]